MKKLWYTALCAWFLAGSGFTFAQNTFRAVVKDKHTGVALPGVIATDKQGHGNASNDSGLIVITGLDGAHTTIYFTYLGYDNDSVTVSFADNKLHTILLNPGGESLEEVTIVSSTRSNERIENAPTKVEVLDLEAMEDENTIKPANIASIIGDVSGVQIQQSSATSGNTNVRIQGLNGQYTQVLRDGMPLFDGFSGGFGILQIPPLDLRQIELIKGSASTLYGGGAIAGLINLISKRPALHQEAVFTFNATTLQEQDVNVFLSKRNKKFGYTLFAGYVHQNAVDVNSDDFSDVPMLSSFTLHPRFYYYPDNKSTLILAYNATIEQRTGGSIQVIENGADLQHQYFEKNKTQRHTGEAIFERALTNSCKLTAKGSFSSFSRDIVTNLALIKGNQQNYYGEVSLFVPQKANSIVVGVTTTGFNFKTLPGSEVIALSSFSGNTVGAFAQYNLHLGSKTTAEAGLRGDLTNKYGGFVLPRIALFHRINETWAVRAGAGLGYKTPNPLEVQIIDYPLPNLQQLPAGIKAERSAGYNLEGNFKKEIAKDVSLFVNHAFFLTQIVRPVIAAQWPTGEVFFSNATDPVITMGFDTYVKLTIKELELYAGYTYTDAERKYLTKDQFLPFTPRNRFAFVAAQPFLKKWRIGLEGSYTGPQYRDSDTKTPGYFFAAMMIERKFGKLFTVVLNGENLLNYRQTKHEQIVSGSITEPTFKPLWAPIDGRVINLSLRITPFNK